MRSTRVTCEGNSYRLTGEGIDRMTRANEFLETLQIRGLSLATIRAYAFDLLNLARWLFETEYAFKELTAQRLMGWIAFQKQAHAQPNSINRRLTTCMLFYRFVTGEDLSDSARISPALHYKGRGRDHALGLHRLIRQRCLRLRVRTPRKLIEPLEVNQVLLFLRSLTRYRDVAIVYLMLLCGLRSGEILSLQLSDLHFQDDRLLIHGKGNQERALPLSPGLRSVLSDYLRFERPSEAVSPHFFVVLQGIRRGHAMTPAGLRNLFRYRRKTRKTLHHANAHRFRHTFGADMARVGVRLPILQRMMGHADAKTTLHYINLSMGDIAAEYARAIEILTKRYPKVQT